MKKYITLIILVIIIFSFISGTLAQDVKHYNYKIINSYPHNKNSFTQGLEFFEGYLYEGTGLKGNSFLKKINLKTAEVKKIYKLADIYFGEGITIFNEKIYQLTWKSNIGFIYNLDFKLIDQFFYEYQGWGLTHDNNHLIISDGTNTIRFLDPKNLKVVKKIKVSKNSKKVTNINELEYIKGKIYANIWQKNYIVIIEPETGRVTGVIDLEGIINKDSYNHDINVLNGIAYDSKNNRLLVTGKFWPKIFEIEIKKD